MFLHGGVLVRWFVWILSLGRVTIHGLVFGIPAEMTVFSSLSALVYNGGCLTRGRPEQHAQPQPWSFL